MKRKTGIGKSLLPVAIVLSSLLLLGWANSWEDIRKESAKVTSINARFIQTKHMKILAKPLISTGRFYFQAPDSVRWEYTAPVKSILLMSQNGIKRYTQGSKGLVQDASGSLQSMQIVLQSISQWSKGRFTDNDHFAATLKPGKEPQIILTPKEKGMAALISGIMITLAADKTGVLRSVKIVEGEENFTLFEFRDVQMNAKIRESLFREVE